MVNARATNNNKKRSATTKIQGKPSKSLKKADPVEEVIRDLDLLLLLVSLLMSKYSL